jgi:hypothetical protein
MGSTRDELPVWVHDGARVMSSRKVPRLRYDATSSQGVGQLRSLDNQHGHRLVPVAVAGGPADPEPRG